MDVNLDRRLEMVKEAQRTPFRKCSGVGKSGFQRQGGRFSPKHSLSLYRKACAA